jgi:hypothetical protein
MTAYYNENENFAAQWLRNLIAAGHIAPGEVRLSVQVLRGSSSYGQAVDGTLGTEPKSSLAISSSQPCDAAPAVHALACVQLPSPSPLHRTDRRGEPLGSADRSAHSSCPAKPSPAFSPDKWPPSKADAGEILARSGRSAPVGTLQSRSICSPDQPSRRCAHHKRDSRGHRKASQRHGFFCTLPYTLPSSICGGTARLVEVPLSIGCMFA